MRKFKVRLCYPSDEYVIVEADSIDLHEGWLSFHTSTQPRNCVAIFNKWDHVVEVFEPPADKIATHTVLLRCHKCQRTDLVLNKDAKDWKCFLCQ